MSSNNGPKIDLNTDFVSISPEERDKKVKADISDYESKVAFMKQFSAKETELKVAISKKDQEKLKELIEYFRNLNALLKNDSADCILQQIEQTNIAIRESGMTALKRAELDYYQAKLSLLEESDKIREAANMNLNSLFNGGNTPKKGFKKSRKRDLIVLGGAMAGGATMILAALGLNSCTSKNNTPDATTTTTTLESTITGSTTGLSESTTSTGDYSVETVTVDYSSPTRESTTADSSNGNGGSGNADTTYETLRPTTDPTSTSVISTPTNGTAESVSYETSAIPTDINGTQPGHTEPEVKPTGTDPLPVEPTRVTVDVTATEPTTTTTTTQTEATTKPTEGTTAPTTAPTTRQTEGTTVTVPVVTVDPNDPDNVIEKQSRKAKTLGLRLI